MESVLAGVRTPSTRGVEVPEEEGLVEPLVEALPALPL
jgi:hypothetical protein